MQSHKDCEGDIWGASNPLQEKHKQEVAALKKRHEELEKETAALKKRNEELEKEVAALKTGGGEP